MQVSRPQVRWCCRGWPSTPLPRHVAMPIPICGRWTCYASDFIFLSCHLSDLGLIFVDLVLLVWGFLILSLVVYALASFPDFCYFSHSSFCFFSQSSSRRGGLGTTGPRHVAVALTGGGASSGASGSKTLDEASVGPSCLGPAPTSSSNCSPLTPTSWHVSLLNFIPLL